MKKSTKIALTGGLMLMTAILASSCTSNFCTNTEKSRMLFAIEPGVSEYYDSKEDVEKAAANAEAAGYTCSYEKVYADNDNLWRSILTSGDGYYAKSMTDDSGNVSYVKYTQLASIFNSAKAKYIALPSIEYFSAFDTKVLSLAVAEKGLSVQNIGKADAESALVDCGYLKFYGAEDTVWGNYAALNGTIATEIGIEKCPTNDYVSLYQSTMNTTISNSKACIATVSDKYGTYGQFGTSVSIDAKDWGYAWSKGPISGLIVYPVAWLTDTLTASFAGGVGVSQLSSGWPQLLALVIVTVIVRLFIFACTFKSTLSQQKMQSLQPELAKIQAKYPNANTSQSEKQRLAEEQMKLYKKNHVNPLSQLLVLVIQFPIFIGVWGAMIGSAVLSTGAFLNLNLSTSIWDALKNVSTLPGNGGGWWTALILFILMAAAQFLAMKVPQWITKARTKKIARLGVNPAQKQQNKTMNIISYGMLIMIIVMGFTLPAAMGVYWFVGAIFSLAQSLITQAIIDHKKKK